MTTLKNKKGVSLVELIAVIVIMGIIATVGGISVATIIENSNKSAAETAVSDVLAAGKSYLQSNPTKEERIVSLADLEAAGYVEASLVGKFGTPANVKVYEITTAGSEKIVYVISDGESAPAANAETTTVVTKAGYTVTYTVAEGKFAAKKGA